MLSRNRLFVINIVSIAVMIYGIAMIPSFLMAARYNEPGVYQTMIIISFMCIILGFAGYRFLPNDISNVRISVCYKTTIMTWILLIILSAMPYYTAGMNYSFVDSLYESVASWTTTGTSAIPTAALPVGLKLWRSTCNWMGGIGIILLATSFLPQWQFIGQKLVSTEIRGPGFLMSTTTFRKAYRRIIFVYLGLTVAHYICLRIAGMGQLQSILTSLSNISTSGLQHLNNGVITGFSLPLKIVITVFAFIGSVNVSIFVILLVGKFRKVIQNSEIKLDLLIICVVTALMTLSIVVMNHESLVKTLGNIFMQVISFASTAGYIVTRCDHWNSFNIFLISILMFIGACAISAGGGLKVSRMVYAFKSLSHTIYKHIHPSSVRTIMYNGEPAKREHIIRSNMYIAMFMIIYLIGAILITADGTEAYTALSYSQAMLTNVGSPISQLADPGIVSGMTSYSKLIMSVLMLCGRLEIYPILMLFSVRLWHEDDPDR